MSGQGDVRGRWQEVSRRLDELLDLDDDDARNEVLARLRADDPALADEVGELLAVSATRDPLLDAGGAAASERLANGNDAPAAVSLPERIGPWRIRGMLGQGGMGTVYAGEREGEGFLQRAAVKVLHRGGTGELRARFLAERRILAGLDHPGIARMLDGGVADDGTPYLAMERVDGIPITVACQQRRASVEDRLRLFLDVCAAIGHAHRNLVVHRDLKPSNVLVDHDGRARLLDFGIAKLLAADTGAPAPPTLLRAMTPQYAAPEQVRGETVTTATDVYALGVLLFELLAGRTPYVVTGASPFTVEQAILEATPYRLPQAAVVDASRPEGGRLARRLTGDLERIVERAMAREPERRYATVDALADDVRRHLDGKPVVARGDSVLYRASRFAHRHRLAVTGSLLAVLALIAALATAVGQARRAGREAARARAQAELAESSRAFLASLFAGADPNQAQGRVMTDRELLARGVERIDHELADRPELATPLRAEIASVYLQLGEYEHAEPLARRVLADETARHGDASPEVARARRQLAEIRYQRNDFAGAIALDEQAEERLAASPEPADRQRVLDGRVNRAKAHFALGHYEPARAILDAADVASVAAFGADSPQRLAVVSTRASQLLNAGNLAAGAAAARDAAELARRIHGPDAPPTLSAELNEVVAAGNLGERERARHQLTGLPERLQRVLGPAHGETLLARRLEARLASADGDFATARQALAPVLAALRAADQPQTLGYTLVQAANVEVAAGEPARAEALASEAVAVLTALLGEHHPDTAFARSALGHALAHGGALARAERELAQAATDEIAGGLAGSDFHADTLDRRGDVALRAERKAEARAWLEQAVTIRRSNAPAGSRGLASSLLLLARALEDADGDRRRALLAEAVTLFATALGPAHPERRAAEAALAACQPRDAGEGEDQGAATDQPAAEPRSKPSANTSALRRRSTPKS